MPELPEVETVVCTLQKHIINKTITNVNVILNKVVKNVSTEQFQNMLVNEQICQIKRRGKHIVFLTNNYCVICHLRMEGKFYYVKKISNYIQKHSLIIFKLSNQHQLIYHDTRRFGTFHIYPIKEYENNLLFKNIGLEPFDKKLTAFYLKNAWKNKNKPIKGALLEQNIICGIGNIYACEILYDAQISPFKPAKNLTLGELKALILSTKKILRKAIRAGGTTVFTFSIGDISGKFQNQLKVYGKHNQHCENCNSIILKYKVCGRGTFFCPLEQKVTLKDLKKYKE